MLTFQEYQESATKTAIFPSLTLTVERLDYSADYLYTLLGLVNEAGEAAQVAKKVIRDRKGEWSAEARQSLIGELGDVLWYLSATASVFGETLDSIAQKNLDKLVDRKARGVLSGSGDKR